MVMKNPNLGQRMIQLQTDKTGKLSLRSTNGTGISTVLLDNVIGPPDLNYCINWAGLYSVAKTMRAQEAEITVHKNGLKLAVGESVTKLNAQGTRDFVIGLHAVTGEVDLYSGEYDGDRVKCMRHSSKEEAADIIPGTVALSGDYAYTFRYSTVHRTRFKPVVGYTGGAIYLRFKDFVALSRTVQGKFTLSKEHFVFTHSVGILSMPIVDPKRDLAKMFEKAFNDYKVVHKVEIRKTDLLRGLKRAKEVAGVNDITLTFSKGWLTLSLEDEDRCSYFKEVIPCQSEVSCCAVTKTPLLTTCVDNLLDKTLIFSIPDLSKQHDTILLGDTGAEEMIVLRKTGKLQKV